MKKLHVIINKGDSIDGIGLVAEVESRIMDGSIQYADTDEAQDPEDMAFLTAKESFQIIIKNYRRRKT